MRAGRWRRVLVQLLALVRKEVRQTARDRRMVFMLLFAPVFQLTVLGFAVDLDVDHVATVIVDHDRTSASREHLQRLLADGTLAEVGRLASAREAESWLDAGRASVAIVVPPGFGEDLARGRDARVQVLVDGSDPNRATIASAAVARYFQGVAIEMLRTRARRIEQLTGHPVRAPLVRAEPRVLYNPRLDSAIYMVPGVAVLVLIIVTTVVTAMGIAREREIGTLEQVMVTPIGPGTLMLGKALPFVAVGLFDVLAAITVAAWVFDLPVRGSLLLLLAGTVLYLFTTLGVGLLVSTMSENQQQAFMGGLFFIMPAILLAGVFTPVHSMPRWMQALTAVNPVRYYIELVRAVLLKAAGPADVAVQLLALGAIGIAILTLAASRFRKRLG